MQCGNISTFTDAVWRNCPHCGCSRRLLLFQEVSSSEKELRTVYLMLNLVSRKAAIPVPGPIGGGSLSDWKEAEGTKGDVKSGNSKSGNTEAGNSKD